MAILLICNFWDHQNFLWIMVHRIYHYTFCHRLCSNNILDIFFQMLALYLWHPSEGLECFTFYLIFFCMKGTKQTFCFLWKQQNGQRQRKRKCDPNQDVFLPLVTVNKCKKQSSKSNTEKISGDQISKNANLNVSEKQVKK